jgi:hypothetical protein
MERTWIEVERAINKCRANVLTIMEGAFGDPVQRNAVKDLIKKQFNQTLDILRTPPGPIPIAPPFLDARAPVANTGTGKISFDRR